MTDDFFSYAPIVTMTDVIEAAKVAAALLRAGLDAVTVERDVLVEWANVSRADALIRELRQDDQAADWSKIQIDWYERTAWRRH
jgi:hypothetical protein